MAPVKRKATATERPAKRSKSDDPAVKHENTKSAKPANGSKKGPKPDKDDNQDRKPVKASLLQSEERAFPRGGASVLTPLEHKQIKLEAERDVLFERSGQKKPKSDLYSDDEQTGVSAETTRPSKKRRKSGKGRTDADANGTPQVKIQGLSYKNLLVGSIVLGQVTAITSKDVALALPNNLIGFVPLTAISERVNQKIETLLAEDETEKEGEVSDDDDDLDLKSLFHIGQYLRACVMSTAEDSTVNGLRKSKKRIELSVDPRQANSGLAASDVVVNNTVQASVRSVEDHGLVMDLGLEDPSVKGFMSKKDFGKGQDITRVQEGSVLLCTVTGLTSNKVVKLAADTTKLVGAAQYLSEAPTVDAFLPGTAVELLVTESGRGGLAGKVMGMLDATADLVHSGAGGRGEDISKTHKIGSKVKARIINTFPSAENKKVGVSLLDHVVGLQSGPSLGKGKTTPKELHSSEIIEESKVLQVEPAIGLFLDVGVPGRPGFAHISRISDKKIETLSETVGAYKVGSTHRARVLSYNPVDGMYNVSLEQKVLDQPFLRMEDVAVGSVVKGKVNKIILGAKGVTGVLVDLAEGIDALVPEIHMADVHLQHPEKKFREGFPVTARVLSVDLDRRQIRLTMKKTLINSEAPIWKSYSDIAVGDESLGTIINILPKGAVVQFYGSIRAWLPVSEMSEAYIQDPSQHFRLGQTVNVHAISVDAEADELKVSCKDPSAFGESQQQAWDALKNGQLINATVTEKSGETVMLDIEGSDLKAVLRVTHLVDGSQQKALSALKQIRVGQKLSDLVAIEKLDRRHLVVLSNKPSLVKAAKAGTLISSFSDVVVKREVHGFVRRVTPDGVFVQFAGGVVGYLPKTGITLERTALPAFGLRADQSIAATVFSVDPAQQRFLLTLREVKQEEPKVTAEKPSIAGEAVINPVDEVSSSIADYAFGKETQARIVSVKDTQLNVQLADNIQGRIDVSEVFDNWEDIKDRKRPLQRFKPKQALPVRILGIHDARNHRFLPITHRQARIPVYELTAKSKAQLSSETDLLTMDKLEVGSSWIAYVNNIDDKCLWVNLSPNVRGRLDVMDLSEDVSLLQDLPKNFPVGSAIRVRVKNVDASTNRLDLTVKTSSAEAMTLQTLTKGAIVPGKITKVTERNVIVKLSDSVSGAVTLTELADDYEEANPTTHSKDDIVRVSVVDIDIPNKRVFLSLRPSKVLSSALPVEDPQIISLTQLKVNTVLRGFVKTVTDKGVVVNLGPRVDAFVRVSDLSDAYIKDWKSAYQVDQLVKGRILAVDPALNHVQMSLKQSHVDKNYVPPATFADLKPGQIVTGKVRKVEDFGVFIDVDNTIPRVSGLCHRSQIADTKVDNIKSLYDEGDQVKAKVLSVDTEKKRISFGLKASYFKDADDDEEMDDDEEEIDGSTNDEASEDEDMDGGIDLSLVRDAEEDEADASSADEMDIDARPTTGLSTSGFDWSGAGALDQDLKGAASESEAEAVPKKKKRRAQIQEDLTGELDAHGPRSVADFERLLLTSPNDAALWIQYMAFQLGLSEVEAAREIGQRALRTINMREQDEKRDVWIALLNLEVSFGDDERVEQVFKEACQVQDPLIMHERMASIYIDAGKFDAAEKVFDKMASTKAFRASGDMWLNHATFLMEKMDKAPAARALLPRAMQSVLPNEHRLLTAKFAALEFRTKHGDPERGRTIFEGLVAEWPKWTQGWDMWVDLEKGQAGEEAKEKVRALYERMAKQKMKKRRARFVFKKWLEYEEASGDAKSVERVKAIAKAYVEGMKEEAGGDEE